MLIDDEDNMSDPCVRVSLTIILRPRLASQALNVNIIKLTWWIDEFKFIIVSGINSTMDSIMPSKYRSDINRWL